MESNNPGRNSRNEAVAGPGGVVLDQYILLEKLSTSRTGLVFKAKHRLMGRIVTVKFLSPEAGASPTYTARFHRAIQILSRLQHPNIMQVYEVGQQGDVQYVVMEYVDGKDLRTMLKEQGPLSVEDAVGWIVQAAAGLAHVHAQGVTHRNIKPGNLLLDREGVVKIVGFTLAHVEAGGAASEAGVEDNLTRQGQVMGTYDYMSPEQSLDSSSVDRRADIYSLGCTLHALLTGRPPYAGKAAMQQVLAHRTQPIPSLRQARPEVPEALERVFQKMMAKSPGDRYASMEEAAAELEASLTAAPPAVESTADKLRAVIGLPTGPLRPAASDEAAAKPKARQRKREPRMVPIVVGGVLGVLTVVFAAQYFQDKKSPEVAKSATPHNSEERPTAVPTTKQAPVSEEVPVATKSTPPETTTQKPLADDAKTTEKPVKVEEHPVKTEEPVELDTKSKTKSEENRVKVEEHPVKTEKVATKSEDSRAAVPDEAARQRALKLLHDTFQDELAAARTNVQKASLAQKMLGQSKTLGDDPAGRLVLLETSCSLAKEGNDPATALETADLMAQYYAVDAWSKKTELSAEMAKAARTGAQHRAVAEQVLLLAQKAADEHRSEIAAKLSELAVAEAGKAGERKLLVQARAAAKQSGQALTRFRQYEAAKAKLQQEPASGEANLTAGRYECLVIGDWESGLRKLAAGSDASLRGVATKDLAAPTDADAQAAVGDGWWELALDEAGPGQVNLYRRAAWWYEKALTQATGLLRTKLEKRLDTIKAATAKATGP